MKILFFSTENIWTFFFLLAERLKIFDLIFVNMVNVDKYISWVE